MLDNQVIISLRSAIVPRLAARGIAADVKQGNQPTQQGVPSGPLVSLFKITDKQYGYPERSTRWDEDELVMYGTESQQMESTYQFTAVAQQDPSNDFELTPADILKATAAILRSDAARAALLADGVSVLRVQDVRTGYTIDDSGEFMPNPTFDITVTHRDTTTEIIGIINAQEVIINRV